MNGGRNKMTTKYLYKYTDNKTKLLVFSCHAENILEADKKFQEATGKNIMQEKYIGCEIVVDCEK